MARNTNASGYTYDYPRPMVTVDLIVITPMADKLKVLLIRRDRSPYEGCWGLPGGFVEMEETLAESAQRELAEETNLKLSGLGKQPGLSSQQAWMEQLHTFGDPDRDPRGRVISIAFLVLVRPGRLPELEAGDDAAEAQWFSLKNPPKLAFDHRQMLRMAEKRLMRDHERRSLVFQLVPSPFTMDELRSTCEMILGDQVDAREFRRRMKKLEEIEPARNRDGATMPGKYIYRPA